MGKSFFVVSGISIAERRERAPSASEALHLIREHMKLRCRGVRVEDVRGNPVSFFELTDLAALEDRKKNASRS